MDNVQKLIRRFSKPESEYSALAFWFWNGQLEKEKLVWQINEMRDKGIHGAFMHARAYLKTPYLEDEWWNAVDACVKRGQEIGFNPWLYDEYAWPSGTVGSTFDFSYQKPSRTLARGERNMAKGLYIKRYTVAEKTTAAALAAGEDFFAAFECSGGGNFTRLDPNQNIEQCEVLIFFRKIYPRHVDYLNKDTIKQFIELTHEEYRKRYSAYFGNVIPGIFFDEIYMMGNPLPWTDLLPEEFKKRAGYDLLPVLPALIEGEAENHRRVRADYFRIVAQLYEEAFFVQISDWCEKNNLQLTGHTEEYLGSHPLRQGNFFNTIRHLQIPGADCHDYRYRFPRKITYIEPKYSVSVARAYGKQRAMSESMGGAGWGCSLQQFKRGINTMGAMGINMFILHGFYNECEHQGSQADWPTSFFYQNPYWKYFGVFGAYMNRVSLMNSLGEAVVEAGLYYPIEDIQVNTINGSLTTAARGMNDSFHNTLNILLEHQIDTDLIDAECLLRGEIKNGYFIAGQQRFKILLFPCGVTLAPGAFLDKLNEFIRSGGVIIFYHDDKNGNGLSSEAPRLKACPVVTINELPGFVNSVITPDILVLEGSRANLFTCHRKINGLDVYFVSNSSPKPREIKLQLRESGAAIKMDIETGETWRIPASAGPRNTTVLRLDLREDEACYVLIDPAENNAPLLPNLEECEEIALSGKWSFLPLDNSFTDQYSIDAACTEMRVAMADFSSDLRAETELIRICNMDGDNGYCGRHLSLWEAKWIARRPSWHDSTDNDLYFRRAFELDESPDKGRICLAAITGCEVYVNGSKVCEGGKAARSVDISAALKKGRNIIAARVHNDNPLRNFTSIHELPPDNIIAFILEAEITAGVTVKRIASDDQWIVNNHVEENWLSPDVYPEKDAVRVDVTHRQSAWSNDTEGVWIYAWERGKPPLHPWGELPFFDKELDFPRKLNYGITLPAGTTAIKKPEVRGNWTCSLNGRQLDFSSGWAAVANTGRSHYANISVDAENLLDGLQKPVTVTVEPFEAPLADWRLFGHTWFSGRARYGNTVRVNKKSGRYIIDLGQVNFSAEIWVNGVLAGIRVWNPYRLDITGLIKDGENRIVVVAANSAAVERRHMLVDEGVAVGWDRYWNEDNIDREAENMVSGLLGPVRIFRYSEVR